MTTIKKSYVELVEFLTKNKNKKVETILDEVINMTTSQKREVTFHKIDDEVVAIFCYYHKRWELLTETPYGKKKQSTTGFNTMCKAGVNAWTKQQREAKQAEAELLTKVATHEVAPEDILHLKEEIEETRKLIHFPEEGYISYDTLEQALESLTK